MDNPEIVVKQAASGVGWRTAAIVILVAAGVAVGVRECEHKTDLAKKQTALDSTGKVAAAELAGRLQAEKANETVAKERAQRDQKFTEALAKTQADVNRIAEWAESLDISRQIGEIAKKLPKPLQGDSLRIQRNYTPNDVAIIKELYKQIEEGKLYKGKYETAEKQVTDYRADNDSLKQNIADYKRGYTVIRQRLLTVYQERAFLNIGLGKEVLKVAEDVGRISVDPSVTSELEKELNKDARHR